MTRGPRLARLARALLALALLGAAVAAPAPPVQAAPAVRVWLPIVFYTAPAPPMPPTTVGALTIVGAPTDRPAAEHPDLNLALRGYAPTDAPLRLVDYGGGTDPHAPRLTGLLGPGRGASITSAHRVYGWDWAEGRRTVPLASPPVTLIGLAATPGEGVYVPPSGYVLDGSGYAVLVLYADGTRVTLKYTREDNVVQGYTLHLEGLRVHPEVLGAYARANAAGRAWLPAMPAGAPVGVAGGSEVQVAVRDAGTFMDPRSRKDWW